MERAEDLVLSVSENRLWPVAAPEDYQNIAVSQVSDYVNIRQEPSVSGQIVGKIYNNCAATILRTVEGEGGNWYQIQSGNVSGYIKAQYFITGAQAEEDQAAAELEAWYTEKMQEYGVATKEEVDKITEENSKNLLKKWKSGDFFK